MKRTPLRSRSKTPKAKLKRKADALWSQCIRSSGQCAMGKYCLAKKPEPQLHAHHLIGRRNLATRWRIENGVCLCSVCHTLGTESAHENTLVFQARFEELYPARYNWWMQNRHAEGKVDVAEVADFLADLLDELTGNH